MKLSWMFGSSMEAHHLLYVYVSVWLIQGGYACWVAWQWSQAKRISPPMSPDDSEANEES